MLYRNALILSNFISAIFCMFYCFCRLIFKYIFRTDNQITGSLLHSMRDLERKASIKPTAKKVTPPRTVSQPRKRPTDGNDLDSLPLP